jgi:large subunit ribosomal protein L5
MKKYESLHDRLRGPIAETLKKELKVANTLALPRIEKVIVNVGINRSKLDSREAHEYVAQCLAKITGQKAVFTRARKAISNFKIRQGLTVGAVVTLHGRRMEEFLDRLISYVLPRTRDFRGVTQKLDGHGNFAIGIRDHSVFPEAPPPDAGKIFGMQVQIKTTAKTDEPARALLKHIGIPFRVVRAEKKSLKP